MKYKVTLNDGIELLITADKEVDAVRRAKEIKDKLSIADSVQRKNDAATRRFELIFLKNGETDSEFVNANTEYEALSILGKKIGYSGVKRLEFGEHVDGRYKILKSWK